MKIVKLAVSNVKRITAVEITPDGSMITLGGKNGAGKSSVLDAIGYALGGQALVPSEPIRKGEGRATVTVDLGEFVVERKFRRKKLLDGVAWGPTTSTLSVKSTAGAVFPSPQAMLDKFMGQLTFDPLAFAAASKEVQAVTLRALVGLDTSELEEQRRTAYTLRTDLNRQMKTAQARLDAVQYYPDAPKHETPAATVTAEIDAAQEQQRHAEAAARRVFYAEVRCSSLGKAVKGAESRVAKAAEDRDCAQADLDIANDRHAVLAMALTKATEQVPNIDGIRQKLEAIEAANARVRESAQHTQLAIELEKLSMAADRHTRTMEEIDAAKARQVADAVFPVDDLGLSNGQVTFGGVPLKQASTGEQIRVSVAIGLALNPTLKVLLVRQGSALDKTSLADVARQAEAAEAQVWVERVTETGDGVSVMIEDGAVVETVGEPETSMATSGR